MNTKSFRSASAPLSGIISLLFFKIDRGRSESPRREGTGQGQDREGRARTEGGRDGAGTGPGGESENGGEGKEGEAAVRKDSTERKGRKGQDKQATARNAEAKRRQRPAARGQDGPTNTPRPGQAPRRRGEKSKDVLIRSAGPRASSQLS